MRLNFKAFLAIVIATCAMVAASSVSATATEKQIAGADLTEVVTLVISREQGTEPVLTQFGYEAERITPYYEIITIPAVEAQDLIPHLKRLNNVRAVEEDYRTTYVPPKKTAIVRAAESWNYYEQRREFATRGPNDTYFIDQTAWMEPHEYLAGVSDILRAWKVSEKVQEVRVAIVDSGFDTHSDLAWSEGINLNFPTDLADAENYKRYRTECADIDTANYHGQQVGSIVGANANDGFGNAGILDTTMVAVNVAGCGGVGVLSNTMDGIRWAAGDPNVGMYPISEPARIINVSRSTGAGETDCPTYAQDAIDYATDRGFIVTVSAGNYTDVPSDKIAPGNCEGVITVANIGRDGTASSSTSRGSAVDLSAIGVLVPVSAPNGDEQRLAFGTSFSAPTVAGSLGLLWQQLPELSRSDVIKIAKETARPLPGNPSGLGWGVIDPYRMLEKASAMLSPAASTFDHPERTGSVTPGLSSLLESKGHLPNACNAAELSVETNLEKGQHIVVYKVPAGDPLNRLEGTAISSSVSRRFLTDIDPDISSQYGYQICEDSDGKSCTLDALVELDVSGLGLGQSC